MTLISYVHVVKSDGTSTLPMVVVGGDSMILAFLVRPAASGSGLRRLLFGVTQSRAKNWKILERQKNIPIICVFQFDLYSV